MSSGWFKIWLTNYLLTNHIYIIHICLLYINKVRHEHLNTVNENGKPPDSINRSGMLFEERKISLKTLVVHSWFKATLLLF